MLSRKINFTKLSTKYERLAAVLKHDADRLRFAGVVPAADILRDLSDQVKEMAVIFAPVRNH